MGEGKYELTGECGRIAGVLSVTGEGEVINLMSSEGGGVRVSQIYSAVWSRVQNNNCITLIFTRTGFCRRVRQREERGNTMDKMKR